MDHLWHDGNDDRHDKDIDNDDSSLTEKGKQEQTMFVFAQWTC
jgi:hypothetical protein